MGKRIEYTAGELINGIKFLREADPDIQNTIVKRNHRRGWFECPRCLIEFTQRYASIKNGAVKSCGCYNKSGEAYITHGLTGSRIMKIWTLMKQRCYNLNNTNYDLYGAKGIRVCDDWLNNVEQFNNWAINSGYSESLTLDRVDGTKGYCPENCRWTTQFVQTRNRGKNRNNTSGYKGVYFESRSKKYIASITVNYKKIYIGNFDCPEEAGAAYDAYIVTNNLEHKINRSILNAS